MATYLQKHLVPVFSKNRKLIIQIFQLAELSTIFIWGFGGYLLARDFPENYPIVHRVGTWFGRGALILYVLTLLPGIIRRVQFLVDVTIPIARILTMFRRHLGILMFLLVFVHMGFVYLMPLGFTNQLSLGNLPLEVGHIFGITAFIMLFPLWITSNDISLRILGPVRNTIHRLTYVILFIIFLHVSFFNKSWAVVLGILSIALLFSWARHLWLQRFGSEQPEKAVVEDRRS